MDLLITGIILLLIGNAGFALASSKAKPLAKSAKNIAEQPHIQVTTLKRSPRTHWARYSRTGVAIYDHRINHL